MDKETLAVLNGCIHFWKTKLDDTSYLLEPSVVTLIEQTIRFLETLAKKGGD